MLVDAVGHHLHPLLEELVTRLGHVRLEGEQALPARLLGVADQLRDEGDRVEGVRLEGQGEHPGQVQHVLEGKGDQRRAEGAPEHDDEGRQLPEAREAVQAARLHRVGDEHGPPAEEQSENGCEFH
ncbi:hypothetical protein D3C86_1180940 [compost metagenome]